ncbi:MAG: 16S rRNA (guanine(527)-N(7))-methyltransferase RsmG [Sulfurihydrogenibium sp.]|jgi:16S rRNA (guanine527-N7)-methyltransferase|nr:16S rRNA (guanine(527)-N(7))-methyltransferase RsmG [Sulfurihydrogenibium sp.]
MMELLKDLAEKNGIILTDNQLELFDKYLSMLLKWNKVYNLTSVRKKDEIVIKHFLDSLTLIKLFEAKAIDVEGKEIADFGTGAGFPGVPLKIYYQDKIKLYLIESINKKCIFLEMLKKELKIDYTVLCDRAENIDKKFDIVVSRATGETFEVLKIGKNLLKENGIIVIMKGKDIEEELKPYITKMSFKGLPERSFIVMAKY